MAATPAVEKLEVWFQSETVQARLSKFMHQEAEVNRVFADATLAREQKIEYMHVYKKFCGLIESLLEEFLSAHPGIAQKDMLQELAALPDGNDTLVCAPYVLASCGYPSFMQLVAQWVESYADDDEDAEVEDDEP
ncbi:hypothetical protein DIPPA_02866 [Diplonema papillatum]|nr:hypothetical protein DIPPA_02866 [Diplonema papillatum]